MTTTALPVLNIAFEYTNYCHVRTTVLLTDSTLCHCLLMELDDTKRRPVCVCVCVYCACMTSKITQVSAEHRPIQSVFISGASERAGGRATDGPSS